MINDFKFVISQKKHAKVQKINDMRKCRVANASFLNKKSHFFTKKFTRACVCQFFFVLLHAKMDYYGIF